MPKNVYSKELKKLVLSLFEKGYSKEELCKKYNISSIMVINYWIKKYNITRGEAKVELNCFGENIMKKDIKISKLEQRIEELEAELRQKDQKALEDKVQIEFLEKHMPSFIPFWAKGNQKMRQKKEIKHKLFAFIYQNNNKNIKGKSITNLWKILGNLSRDKYAKWCKKWNLNIDGTSTLPDYVPKYEPNALEMILECKKVMVNVQQSKFIDK